MLFHPTPSLVAPPTSAPAPAPSSAAVKRISSQGTIPSRQKRQWRISARAVADDVDYATASALWGSDSPPLPESSGEAQVKEPVAEDPAVSALWGADSPPLLEASGEDQVEVPVADEPVTEPNVEAPAVEVPADEPTEAEEPPADPSMEQNAGPAEEESREPTATDATVPGDAEPVPMSPVKVYL